MILIINKYILKRGFLGISIWPFVVLTDEKLKEDPVFMNHEKIHLQQQLEMLILPFYIIYLLEFLLKYTYYGNAYLAYRNISFERESYQNEADLLYLKKRKIWSWVNYLKIASK